MGWLNEFQYRKSHIIQAASGAGTLYQKQITVHYGSGTDGDDDVYLNSHCRTDFGDVRFTDDDGTTLLDYWIEEKVDGDYVIFWVKVEEDLSSIERTIYVYYGKADATTTSNGDNTFIFYDHFLGDTLDLSKWVVRDGDVTVSDSQLILTGTAGTRGRIDGLVSFNPQTAIHTRSRCSTPKNYEQLISTRYEPTNVNDAIIVYYFATWNFRTSSSGLAYEVCADITNTTEMNIYKILWELVDSTPKATLYQNDILKHSTTTRVPSVSQVCYYRESNQIGGDVYVDWIFVRKYVDPEPSHGAWGIEEEIPEIPVEQVCGIGKSVKPIKLKIDYFSNYLDYGTIKSAIRQALEETKPITASIKKSFEETINVRAKIAETFEETMPITASVLQKYKAVTQIRGNIVKNFQETVSTTADIMMAIITDGLKVSGNVTPLLEKLKELKRKLRKI